MIQILPIARNSFLELAGGSRVYVSRAILERSYYNLVFLPSLPHPIGYTLVSFT